MDSLGGGAVLRRRCCLLLFLSLLVIVLSRARGEERYRDRDGDTGKEEEQGPNLVERAIGTTAIGKRWDTIRTWVKIAWMNNRPPDPRYGRSDSGPGEVMKEAVLRSFEASKETVEQAAASAAKVTAEAMEKTKEKVKRTISTPNKDPDAEL